MGPQIKPFLSERLDEKTAIHVTEIGTDRSNDRVEYQVQISGLLFVARISLKSRDKAKPSPERKVQDWFALGPLPAEGSVIDIPYEHFQRRRAKTVVSQQV